MTGSGDRGPGRPRTGRPELALRLFEQGYSHAAIAARLGIMEASSRQACSRRRRQIADNPPPEPLPSRPAIAGAI